MIKKIPVRQPEGSDVAFMVTVEVFKREVEGEIEMCSYPFLYILRACSKDGFIYKVGMTTNIGARLSSYEQSNPEIELVCYMQGGLAKKFERYIHGRFKSLYKREWYDEPTGQYIVENLEGLYSDFLKGASKGKGRGK